MFRIRAAPLDSEITGLTLLEAVVISTYKKMLIRKWELGGLQGIIKQEIAQCATLWETAAYRLAVQSFLNKKKYGNF
ncbi:hypothetical protein [Peribacillus glennii]|uniref:Uncharacterized protein n=1 Tax=Peribacillus glennii TaxID=2303991 RepID=A0A372LBW4_9BACI|nr:hypothetical protein [Peribacillus glennii]RFU63382.1 hypothetical protein D0466_11615 [Peribacillus glennii]